MRGVQRSTAVLGSMGLLSSVLALTPALTAVGSTAGSASPAKSVTDQLNGVAVVSAHDIWAVGSEVTSHRLTQRALIEHGNGSSWEPAAKLSLGGGALSSLSSVSAVSAADVWAVGSYANNRTHALIVHWNGTQWSSVPAPDLGHVSNVSLTSVSALSASDVWAVGGYQQNKSAHTLVEHWDGTSWTRLPSPSPGRKKGVRLLGVSAVAANDVWAVGYHGIGTTQTGLIEHWDGTSWTQVASPDPGGHGLADTLVAVDAVSATDIWAVGWTVNYDGSRQQGITEHWDGTTWTVIDSVNQRVVRTQLTAVSAESTKDVWAVGKVADSQTFIEHWDGSAWTQVESPSPGHQAMLAGVSALTPRNAWSVGFTNEGTDRTSVITHWNGTAWLL